MWRGLGDFVVDLCKKLIITVISVPIITFATLIYLKSISVAISSFGWDFYTVYWYLVVGSFLLGVLAGYVLYNSRTFFPILVLITIVLIAIFSAYRLHLFPTVLQEVPMWVLFFL